MSFVKVDILFRDNVHIRIKWFAKAVLLRKFSSLRVLKSKMLVTNIPDILTQMVSRK